MKSRAIGSKSRCEFKKNWSILWRVDWEALAVSGEAAATILLECSKYFFWTSWLIKAGVFSSFTLIGWPFFVLDFWGRKASLLRNGLPFELVVANEASTTSQCVTRSFEHWDRTIGHALTLRASQIVLTLHVCSARTKFQNLSLANEFGWAVGAYKTVLMRTTLPLGVCDSGFTAGAIGAVFGAAHVVFAADMPWWKSLSMLELSQILTLQGLRVAEEACGAGLKICG